MKFTTGLHTQKARRDSRKGRPFHVDRWQFQLAREPIYEAGLGCYKMNRSLHLPARILKVLHRDLNGFNHV